MKPFDRFQIEHLSPSSLNLWQAEPGLWALRYLMKVRDETNAAMARGKAVEDGLLHILHGRKGALETAIHTFDMNLQGELTENIEAERDLIPGMIEQCEKWTPPKNIMGSQIKIEHYLEGVDIPVIGFIDFAFEETDVDLKTTKAVPSAPKADHCRQVALYRMARKTKGGLLYLSSKKSVYHDVDDAQVEKSMAELHGSALSLQRFLSHFTDSEDIIRCLPINTDSFRFSEAAKTKLAELHLT